MATTDTQVFQLSMDTAAVLEGLKMYYIAAMEKAEDKLIELMQEEIQRTTYGGAPGKPEWRNELSDMLKETYRDIANDVLEMKVGLPDTIRQGSKYLFVRAMIIAEGSGSAVGNSPITAGPTGRNVWNNDLDGKHRSAAQSTYLLPAEFNQTGNHFIENAVDRMEKHFTDIIESVSSKIVDPVFYSAVYSTGGN